MRPSLQRSIGPTFEPFSGIGQPHLDPQADVRDRASIRRVGTATGAEPLCAAALAPRQLAARLCRRIVAAARLSDDAS